MFISYKSITVGKKRVSGRNNQGLITCWHRGGSHKQKYKFIDYFRKENSNVYLVCGFEFDSIRRGYVVVVCSKIGSRVVFSRVLFAKSLFLGALLKNVRFNAVSFNVGNSYYLKDIPVGSLIHNIESIPFSGGKFVRASGCFGQVIQKSFKIVVKLPSGNLFSFHPSCRCTFGMLGNENKKLVVIGKAGRSRWLGIRPTVRGVAINPVDHPHGGGEGKSQVGRHPVTPWGRLTKGKKTRLNF